MVMADYRNIERPQKIKDLFFYFQKNEILLYLFLHNSILLPVEDCIKKDRGLANVSFREGNFVVEYDKGMFDLMTREQIYYVLLHEAFHVFKEHLQYELRFVGRNNPKLLNISMDCVINEDIEKITEHNSKHIHTLLVPRKPTVINPCMLELEFKKKYKEPQWTTEIVYDWYLEKAKSQAKKNKRDYLKEGSFCRIKKSGDPNDDKYGIILKEKKDGTYDVETRNKEEIFEEIYKLPKTTDPGERSTGNYTLDELIPLLFPTKNDLSNYVFVDCDADFEVFMPDFGSFEKNNETNLEKVSEEQRVLVNRILEEARQIKRMNKKSFSQEGSGHAFFNKIDELYSKNLVNWKAAIRRKIDYFIIKENSSKAEYRSSYLTYLRNPRSKYGILSKHIIEHKSTFAPNILLSIDVSGSIFCSQNELKLFFSEIESLSKWLATIDGNIFTFQWDTSVTMGLELYQPGDWKKIKHGKKKIKGGGGTTPSVAFKYLNSIFQKEKIII